MSWDRDRWETAGVILLCVGIAIASVLILILAT